MSYQVVIGATGIPGWSILKQNAERHQQLIAADPVVKRDDAYFRERISTITSADELVKDYRLLSYALGAFGLEEEIANKALLQQVLKSDVDDDGSLVNRLTDKRYLQFARAFGFAEDGAAALGGAFADGMSDLYLVREFERRVGENDENLRIALNAKRELAQMTTKEGKESTLWYEVLGNPPLKRMFEVAFGYEPLSFGRLPIERQHQELVGKAEQVFGSSSFETFKNPENVEKLIQRFLAQSQIAEGNAAQSSYSIALTLLSNIDM